MGSHLTDKLMMDGHEVTVVDNFFTGRKRNVEHWIGHENFELINHDVVEPLYIEGDCQIFQKTLQRISIPRLLHPVSHADPVRRYLFCLFDKAGILKLAEFCLIFKTN